MTDDPMRPIRNRAKTDAADEFQRAIRGESEPPAANEVEAIARLLQHAEDFHALITENRDRFPSALWAPAIRHARAMSDCRRFYPKQD